MLMKFCEISRILYLAFTVGSYIKKSVYKLCALLNKKDIKELAV